MTDLQIGLWSLPALLALILLRVPVAVAMFAVGLGGMILVRGTWTPTLSQLKTLSYGTFASYSLSVIPLFLLMGQFASQSGMSAALFRAASSWLGHRRGGVAMAAIAACAGFGAICGSSLATAATMGRVALPELRRLGYSGPLATGTLAAGGTLGILIPPSVVLVLYAILAEQNIAKLFVAAFIPGLIAALGYMACIGLYVRVWPESGGTHGRAPLAERFRALAEVWPVIAIFVLVVGGIYGGWFTPTEAAAVGAAATAILAAASRRMGWRGLVEAILATASTTGMIFLILLGAALFNAFLAYTQVPQTAAAWISAQQLSPLVVLMAILLFYLVLGCIMDSLSMVLLTVPIFFPIVSALDFGLGPAEFGLWFGILVLIAVEVGMITPPVGLNLFVINGMARDIPIGQTFRGALPFVITDIVRVAILVAFPALTLWLVRLVY